MIDDLMKAAGQPVPTAAQAALRQQFQDAVAGALLDLDDDDD